MSAYTPISADGHTVTWRTWDGQHDETLGLRWENEGWTATGEVGREKVTYVLRLSMTWQLRQFLLFRDQEEPDLWLGHDGGGRWGEVNGAHRFELDGCQDLHLLITPFTASLPIRRLPLQVGDSTEIQVAHVDVETLGVETQRQRYTRLDTHRWGRSTSDDDRVEEFDVDEFGLVLDLPNTFRRGL